MLRDTYWRELKEQHDTISGQAAGATQELKWQYFMMLFMNPVTIPQPTSSNVPAVEESAYGSTQSF